MLREVTTSPKNPRESLHSLRKQPSFFTPGPSSRVHTRAGSEEGRLFSQASLCREPARMQKACHTKKCHFMRKLLFKDCLRLRIFFPRELIGHCHGWLLLPDLNFTNAVSFHCWQIVSRLVRTTQQKCDNDAFLPRLGLPFTLIRHKKKLFDTAPKTGRIWKRWFHVLVLVWTKNKGFFENHDVTINMWFPRATFPPTQS